MSNINFLALRFVPRKDHPRKHAKSFVDICSTTHQISQIYSGYSLGSHWVIDTFITLLLIMTHTQKLAKTK